MVDKENLDAGEPAIIASQVTLKKRQGANPTWLRRHLGLRKEGNKMWFPKEAKEWAVACFALTGNCRRVSEITRIKEATIRRWKTEEWWPEMLARVQVEKDEELDAKMTKLIDKAVDEINDRLVEGDYVYNAKQDKLIRKKANAKEMATVVATMVDKRQLLRGQPTKRVATVKQDDHLKALAEQFKKFAKAKDITNEVEVTPIEPTVGEVDA
jgi:hypothetical protein